MEKTKEFKITVTFTDTNDTQSASIEFGGHLFHVCPRLLSKAMNEVCDVLNDKLVNPFYNHKTK